MRKSVVLLGMLALLTSCGTGTGTGGGGDITTPPQDFIPEVGEVRLLFEDGVPGDTQIYNYCPSIFVEDDTEYVYYCTNKKEGNVTDYVGYREGKIVDNKVKYTEQSEYILSHGESGMWDSRHACDPTVIKGEFKFHGEDYNYMMAYLGCITSDNSQNETGIAVSKTPKGPWIKCDFAEDGSQINPIVKKDEFECTTKNWGTGQASLVSVDKKGKVLLFTTVGAKNGTFTNIREYDFSNIDEFKLIRERQAITTAGVIGHKQGTQIINNADYGYDEVNRRFFMAKPRQPFGLDGKEPSFIADTIDVYYIDDTEGTSVGDIFFAGNNTSKSWKLIGTIDEKLTGFLRNHNTGLIRDPFGRIDATKNVGVAFTRSDEGGGNVWNSLSTYRIYATGIEIPTDY